MIENGEKYLITTDLWFRGPDGQQYNAVWGTCYLKTAEDVFGFKPSRPSTNWFLVIGRRKAKRVVVAGCQIHYAVACAERPTLLEGWHDVKESSEQPNNRIWCAE